jgi:hypothetical protein
VLNRAGVASPLFPGQILVYATHGFSAAEIAAVHGRVGQPVVAVTSTEQKFASGNASYPNIDVDTMIADPQTYAAAAGVPALAQEMSAGLVLATQEATLRHVAAGGRLTLSDGRQLPVSAVVDAHQIGGHEMATGPVVLAVPAGATADYLLVGGSLTVTAVTSAVHAALPSRTVRVKAHTVNGYMSGVDTLPTQLQHKLTFGEFSSRPAAQSSGSIVPDKAWVDDHLETLDVTQLGSVICNRAIMPSLVAAMKEITAKHLGSLINTADFQYEGGCWSPRVTRAISGDILSSHSWGLAIDINVATNPLGGKSHQDPRLIAIMAEHGFAWGGNFLRPDPAHFEYVGSLPH